MSKPSLTTFVFAAALIGAASAAAVPALAGPKEDAVFARRGYMKLIALNFGPLGAMVKGEAPYDEAAAQLHADNLLALSAMSVANLFPEGTDNDAMFGETRALPEIWSDPSGFKAKYEEMGDAIDAMAEVSGAGLDSLKAAFGQVGKTCGGCHETYRAKEF